MSQKNEDPLDSPMVCMGFSMFNSSVIGYSLYQSSGCHFFFTHLYKSYCSLQRLRMNEISNKVKHEECSQPLVAWSDERYPKNRILI